MASKTIIVPFTRSGVPETGLVPIITIREVPAGTIVVNGATMSEVGTGFYSYNFTEFDENKNYAIICDAGPTLFGGERYAFAGNEGNEVADGGYLP